MATPQTEVEDATSELKSPPMTPTFGRGVLLAAGAANFGFALGIPMALSVMFLDWQESFRASRAMTATVHSTITGIVFGGGVVAGYVINRFGARAALLLGSFLASLGMFLGAFATSIPFLTAFVGILAGCGFCLMQLPSIPCCTQACTKGQGVAIGICTTGGGVISICLPHLYDYLIEMYSWRGAFIIISGITLNCLVLNMVMTSYTPSPKHLPLATASPEANALFAEEQGGTFAPHPSARRGEVAGDSSLPLLEIAQKNTPPAQPQQFGDSGGEGEGQRKCLATDTGNGSAVNSNAGPVETRDQFGHDENSLLCEKHADPSSCHNTDERLATTSDLGVKKREQSTLLSSLEGEGGRYISMPHTEDKECSYDPSNSVADHTDCNINSSTSNQGQQGVVVGRSPRDVARDSVSHDSNLGETIQDNCRHGEIQHVVIQNSSHPEKGQTCSTEDRNHHDINQSEMVRDGSHGDVHINFSHSANHKAFSFRGVITYLKHSHWHFLLDPLSWSIFAFLGIALASIYTSLMLTMDIASNKGHPDRGVFLVLVGIVAGLVGKALSGLFGMWQACPSVLLLAASGFMGGGGLFVLGTVSSMLAVTASFSIAGLSLGVIVTVFPRCLLELPIIGKDSYPLILGMGNSMEGLFDFLLPILVGHMVDVSGTYTLPFFLLGGAAFLCSFTLILVFWWEGRKSK